MIGSCRLYTDCCEAAYCAGSPPHCFCDHDCHSRGDCCRDVGDICPECKMLNYTQTSYYVVYKAAVLYDVQGLLYSIRKTFQIWFPNTVEGSCIDAGYTNCCTSGVCIGEPDVANCYCDDYCIGFGDCCSDFFDICPGLQTQTYAPFLSLSSVISCMDIC